MVVKRWHVAERTKLSYGTAVVEFIYDVSLSAFVNAFAWGTPV